jgi:hypothetical protein
VVADGAVRLGGLDTAGLTTVAAVGDLDALGLGQQPR